MPLVPREGGDRIKAGVITFYIVTQASSNAFSALIAGGTWGLHTIIKENLTASGKPGCTTCGFIGDLTETDVIYNIKSSTI